MKIELNPDGTIKDKETKLFGEEEYVVNIGPQHPATHVSSFVIQSGLSFSGSLSFRIG